MSFRRTWQSGHPAISRRLRSSLHRKIHLLQPQHERKGCRSRAPIWELKHWKSNEQIQVHKLAHQQNQTSGFIQVRCVHEDRICGEGFRRQLDHWCFFFIWLRRIVSIGPWHSIWRKWLRIAVVSRTSTWNHQGAGWRRHHTHCWEGIWRKSRQHQIMKIGN